jgi:anthranilate synthase component II
MSGILVLDNYDSFTWNLVHYLEAISGDSVDVFRNDEISIQEASAYNQIILSPGPGLPSEAGILLPLIKALAPEKPIFGVCLGLQAIAQAFGGNLKQLEEVMHGLQRNCNILDDEDPLFSNIVSPFEAGRYHSWVVDEATLPSCFKVLANDDQGNIMALRHKTYQLCGVQFHPESIMTPDGKLMLKNWLLQYS